MSRNFLAYLVARLEFTVYVDVGLFPLAFPLLYCKRKLFPILPLIVFIPIPVSEVFFVLPFARKWSVNHIKLAQTFKYSRCRELVLSFHDLRHSILTQ